MPVVGGRFARVCVCVEGLRPPSLHTKTKKVAPYGSIYTSAKFSPDPYEKKHLPISMKFGRKGRSELYSGPGPIPSID